MTPTPNPQADSSSRVPTEPGWYWYTSEKTGNHFIIQLSNKYSDGELWVSDGPEQICGKRFYALDGVFGPRIPDWTPPPEPETVSDEWLTLLVGSAGFQLNDLYREQLVIALKELQRRRSADKESHAH